MKPPSPAPSTSPSLADRLETLADCWQHASMAEATRPIPASELDAPRDGLNALADEDEAGDRGGWDRAVRRTGSDWSGERQRTPDTFSPRRIFSPRHPSPGAVKSWPCRAGVLIPLSGRGVFFPLAPRSGEPTTAGRWAG